MNNTQTSIEHCNQKCRECLDDFKKASIPFDRRMCRQCENGIELHLALIQDSDIEKQWDNIDWNSSKWGRYYE